MLAVSAAAIAATWLESTRRPVAEAEISGAACLRGRPRFLRGLDGATLSCQASQKRMRLQRKYRHTEGAWAVAEGSTPAGGRGEAS